jgi:HNH endonuclease
VGLPLVRVADPDEAAVVSHREHASHAVVLDVDALVGAERRSRAAAPVSSEEIHDPTIQGASAALLGHREKVYTTSRACTENLVFFSVVSRKTLLERLMQRVEVDAETGCWLWTGSVMPNGYGKLTVPKGRSSLAHRLMYEEVRGEIPEGLDIDHLCRVRRCVNPDHMEPVSRKVNLDRSPLVESLRLQKKAEAAARRAARPKKHNRHKTHCPQGHPYSAENTREYRGGRRCKACDRIRHRDAYRRLKDGDAQ